MEERDPNASSLTVMLLPDASFKAVRPDVEDIHLTVAYFGHMLPTDPRVNHLRRVLPSVVKNAGGPIPAVANAVGLFPEGERFALVDLIDGIGTFYIRRMFEALYGRDVGGLTEYDPKIDYTHGFTPHITNRYVTVEDIMDDPEIVVPSDPFEFTFDAIGVWHGKSHYEVAL